MRRGLHWGLKGRLTALYTCFMVLVTCAALAILLSLSSREVLASVQAGLTARVQDSASADISFENGALRLDSDFYTVEGDIYLSLYDENLYLLYGKIPYGFDESPPLSDGEVRRLSESGREWYVYDLSLPLETGKTVYLRGITSVTDAEADLRVTVRFTLILLPGLVVLTAVIGYRTVRRALLPVKKITETVQEIRTDADLSRRVGEAGSGRRQDEITNLAHTFDGMLDELEGVFAREKQFVSDVSHELRTPVSVILAQCDAVKAQTDVPPAVEDAVLGIEKKARGMSDLLSQLLFLSRTDQGRLQLHPERIDLTPLVETAVQEEELLLTQAGRGVTIACRAEAEVFAEVDETLFLRLLLNLLSNAAAYSKENGHIDVTVEAENGEAVVCVRDDGIGIAQDALPHIFERFYRADTARAGEGHAGLGLSMAKWIVEAHGGWIQAESVLGEGSAFTFGLPQHHTKHKK